MITDGIFTSESVSEGHPDKLCDRISDAVLDFILKEDPKARVACETFATTNHVTVGGEIGMNSGSVHDMHGSIEKTIRDCIKDIGYEQEGFHWETCTLYNMLHEQSPDIAQGVTGENGVEGAGDQGIMFGYACDETEELMPAPIHYSHGILRNLRDARKSGKSDMLGPDAKVQLSFVYRAGIPVGVDSIVLSTQHHDEKMTSADIREIVEPIVMESIQGKWLTERTKWHVNPTGKFVIGGPDGDAGLTGRKIIVDTYGGAAPHGGGAFSGKDPSKVDRSAAYAARYLAKNVVHSGLAEKCTIQLSYAIGVAEPISINADTHVQDNSLNERIIERKIMKSMDLTPAGIREHLGLNRPIYERTAAYGHFGREPQDDGGFSWERTDLWQ